MHCSSCGARLPPNSYFCAYCGTQVGGTEGPDESAGQTQTGPWQGAQEAKPPPRQPQPPAEDAVFRPDEARGWFGRKKKKRRSSLKQPPRPGMPLWQTLPLVLGTLGALVFIGWGAFHLWQSRDAVRTVTGYLNEVMRRNWTGAYGFTAKVFQAKVPEKNFTAFALSNRSLAYLAYYSAGKRDIKGDRGTVNFLLIDRGGQHTQAAFDLLKESSQWRIYNIRLGESASKGPKPVPVSNTTTTQPDTTGKPETTEKPETRTEPDTQTQRAPIAPVADKPDTKTDQTTEPPDTEDNGSSARARKSGTEDK